MLAETVVAYSLIAVTSFILGLLTGYAYADRCKRITVRQLRIGVAIVITATWVVTILAEILVPTYTVAMVIHAIMGAVVGYLFSEEGLVETILGQRE